MISGWCLCGVLCIPLFVVRHRLVKNSLFVARLRLGKNSPIVARQRLRRNVTAVTNTHTTAEE
jgi:hypothetical protein